MSIPICFDQAGNKYDSDNPISRQFLLIYTNFTIVILYLDVGIISEGINYLGSGKAPMVGVWNPS